MFLVQLLYDFANLTNEDLLHLGMQMGLRFFNKYKMDSGGLC